MTIGDRIKQRRLEIGLTVDQLASQIGKNRATVYRYECNNIENVPIDTLAPLAEALRTTTAYLMGWTDDASLPYYANTPTLSPDESTVEILLANDIYHILDMLSVKLKTSDNLFFDNNPLSDEVRDTIGRAVDFAIEVGRFSKNFSRRDG